MEIFNTTQNHISSFLYLTSTDIEIDNDDCNVSNGIAISPLNWGPWETYLESVFLPEFWNNAASILSTEEKKRNFLELALREKLLSHHKSPWGVVQNVLDLALFLESKGT